MTNRPLIFPQQERESRTRSPGSGSSDRGSTRVLSVRPTLTACRARRGHPCWGCRDRLGITPAPTAGSVNLMSVALPSPFARSGSSAAGSENAGSASCPRSSGCLLHVLHVIRVLSAYAYLLAFSYKPPVHAPPRWLARGFRQQNQQGWGTPRAGQQLFFNASFSVASVMLMVGASHLGYVRK